MAFPITTLRNFQTPCYIYDTALLARTLDAIHAETAEHDNYHVHYAIKANAHPAILHQIAAAGFGADCVSGGEIQAALDAGFPAASIAFAGVGKADWEIQLALKAGIGMFNVESVEELEVLNELATSSNTRARISFRINPDIDAHTHDHITTGRAEDKFGIAMEQTVSVIRKAQAMAGIDFQGLHFHIGSQLLVMDDFETLCQRINELQDMLEAEGIHLANINVGGGLGIDYEDPDGHAIPDFHAYFTTFTDNLQLRQGQQLHFELGRAVVAQMGTLLTRVLYIKHGTEKQFVIVDAGMTELIRPALYGAFHKIDNLTAADRTDSVVYDVVGPICESSDTFIKDYTLPETRRGDLLAIRSAGAYGEAMASNYNCRHLPPSHLI
jgi:diaminopimelate decarboxylase